MKNEKLSKDNFDKDVKSKKGFLNPLKEIIKKSDSKTKNIDK